MKTEETELILFVTIFRKVLNYCCGLMNMKKKGRVFSSSNSYIISLATPDKKFISLKTFNFFLILTELYFILV